MHWILSAFGVAVAWGIVYALTGRLLASFSSYSILLFYSTCAVLIFLPLWLYSGVFKADIQAFQTSSRGVQLSFLAVGLLSAFASYLLYTAIQDKNTTVVSLIEITYPIFTILFIYIFYNVIEITGIGLIGVAVVFVGLFLVILGSN